MTPGRFLIVRLGAMGDIVHALPVVSALRAAYPDARIDWLVGGRYPAVLELARGIDHCLVLGGPSRRTATASAAALRVGQGGSRVAAAAPASPRARVAPADPEPGQRGGTARLAEGGPARFVRYVGAGGLAAAVLVMRRARYDLAFDLQGLIKSAALARLSGARRVVGFSRAHLREPAASVFYNERYEPAAGAHVIRKNLRLLAALGLDNPAIAFPMEVPPTEALAAVRRAVGPEARFAVINPGAAWPNKRWPAERYGAVAAHLAVRHGLRSVALWGPGEEELAHAVGAASNGACVTGPKTSVADVAAILQAASLLVCGDTGPLHIAAALDTPIVGIYGPTNPARNGPWREADVSVSRFEACSCHHQRRCRRSNWCLLEISAGEVTDAVDRRLSVSLSHD